jgi:hypothetical protein
MFRGCDCVRVLGLEAEIRDLNVGLAFSVKKRCERTFRPKIDIFLEAYRSVVNVVLSKRLCRSIDHDLECVLDIFVIFPSSGQTEQ